MICDVIPMKACHILLGRSWQFDRKTNHNGHTNEITLLYKAKKFVLHPLTPSQVASDQTQMRARREEESSKNSTLSPKSEVGESPNSTPKVISHEALLTQKSLLNMLHEEQPSYLLLCPSSLTCLSSLSLKYLPPSIVALLQEFQHVFPKYISHGLPHIRGIEHQIDFVSGIVFLIDLSIGQIQFKPRR